MKKITIASICYESKGRPDVMLQSLQWLADHHYSVCITDGGSSLEFVEKISRMGHDIVVSKRGLRGQMEDSLLRASAQGSHVLYCEIDKFEFLTTKLQETISSYENQNLEYAVIGRTEKIFQEFPYPQYEIERAENQLISRELNQQGDWVGGPALMPSAHALKLKESQFYNTNQNGWGVPWYLLARAYKDNLRVGVLYTGCSVYPEDKNEFNLGYRLYQANHILGCFYEGLGKKYDWVIT